MSSSFHLSRKYKTLHVCVCVLYYICIFVTGCQKKNASTASNTAPLKRMYHKVNKIYFLSVFVTFLLHRCLKFFPQTLTTSRPTAAANHQISNEFPTNCIDTSNPKRKSLKISSFALRCRLIRMNK